MKVARFRHGGFRNSGRCKTAASAIADAAEAKRKQRPRDSENAKRFHGAEAAKLR